MPKVIVQIYPSLGDHEAMREHRPIGRDPEVFHSVMGGLREIATAMDELGYWGLSHVEHHFHSEGLELSPDPGLWNLYLGAATTRLRHGQLGYVLPARDPLRLAESIAMIDHMLEGRLFVGVARGYQQRWMNVLGQRNEVRAPTPDDEAAQTRSRELYFEHFRLIKLAWENDLLQYKSRHYEVPYPYEEGIPNWPPADTLTREFGAPGEVDEDGTLQGVSVVPTPYQDPHPPLFQPFSHSPDTVRWAAREGLIPITMAAPMSLARRFAELYRHEAAKAGRELELGRNMGVLRAFSIHESRSEMEAAIERYDMIAWRDWYGAFGHLSGFRHPDEEGPVPAPGESATDRLTDVGMILGGTVEEVKRSLDAQLSEVPFEYLVWHLPYAAMPKEEALRQLEVFATRVMPDLGFDPPEPPRVRRSPRGAAATSALGGAA
jgi:alkanesulfonate monooxygenase SsuD/methylene tetrahydromethanopterin reductase-like flavin-dependent oxidoreductase (luciferase family)